MVSRQGYEHSFRSGIYIPHEFHLLRSFQGVILIDADLIRPEEKFVLIELVFPKVTSLAECVAQICKGVEWQAIDNNCFNVVWVSCTI